MVDLHCHILPEIDDGAKNADESVELLKAEKSQRVKSIVFTPHFNFERTDIKSFCERRQRSLEILTSRKEFAESGISVKTGAEIFFSVQLNNEDLDPLCFEGTSYILVELPVNVRPYGLTHTLRAMLNRGYIPILAHVERYSYLAADPTVLYDLVSAGCLAQINCGALIKDSEKSSVAMKYLKWELAQLISSDCHNIQKRKPNLKNAIEVVEGKLGRQYAEWLIKNGKDVFDGRYVDIPVMKKPKKVFGIWI